MNNYQYNKWEIFVHRKKTKNQVFHNNRNQIKILFIIPKSLQNGQKKVNVFTLISNDSNHRIERCQRFDKLVVIKNINKSIFFSQEMLEMQKQILLNVRFPFICKLIQYKNTPQKCIFELENCLYDLESYMNKQQLNDNQLQFIAAQIVLALNEIHKSGYIYRALNASHILIAEDGYIRLIGFGFSSNKIVFYKINSYEEIRIFPPEAMQMIFDQSGDWWLLGALLYKLLFDIYPFENDERDVNQLIKEKMQNIKEFPKEIKPELQDLIENLLKRNPKERLTQLESIMQHKYFDKLDWKQLKEKQIESPLKQ
ncbi:unnamed protein product [Paramecium sonneborni]|uniref:Protein kinase domain-containing protein n=1 Tax=Paramecium sonneborni TaxID=65129 RepID=A0A8S1RL16_9CILI|nr:unnamed protein product [Paramecium sonneborni]